MSVLSLHAVRAAWCLQAQLMVLVVFWKRGIGQCYSGAGAASLNSIVDNIISSSSLDRIHNCERADLLQRYSFIIGGSLLLFYFSVLTGQRTEVIAPKTSQRIILLVEIYAYDLILA